MKSNLRGLLLMLVLSIVPILAAQMFDEAHIVEKEPIHNESSNQQLELKVNTLEYDKDLADKYNNIGLIDCSGFVNLRSTPTLQNEHNIIASVYDRTPCDILTEYDNTEGKWFQIKIDDKTGYVKSNYLITGAKALEHLEEAKVYSVDTVNTITEYKMPELERSTGVADTLLEINASHKYNDGWSIEPLLNHSSIKNNVIGIIASGSKLSVVPVNSNWLLLKGIDGNTYIKNDNLSLTEYSVRTYEDAQKKTSFMDEFSNFGVSINKTILAVRSEPNTDAQTVGLLPSNSGVDILEEKDGWTKIASGNVVGYVLSDNIITGDDARAYGEKHSTLKAFTGDEEENVYDVPSRLGNTWTRLAKNQVYDVAGQDGYWVRLDLDGGDINNQSDNAYINVENEKVKIKYSLNVGIAYINMLCNNKAPEITYSEKNTDLRMKIIAYANQFIGNPYVWGGTSLTNGADCSGFTQQVLRHFGIYIPRVSRDQAKVGITVDSPDKLRPGDLIFYADSRGTVNHVAMYIGNGMIVNAGSSKSGICVNTYNYRTPVGMKDVIGNIE